MATRYNTLNTSTDDLATESTLLSAEAHLETLTLQGTQLDKNSGNYTANTQRVVIAENQPAIPVTGAVGGGDVNITEVKGVAISVDNGSADPGTIRVCLPNDVVTTGWENVPTDLAAVGGSAIPVSNGVATGATQRVVLANNQDTTNWGNVPTNLTQLNGNTIGTGFGFTNSGTQRICLANDQPDLFVTQTTYNKEHYNCNSITTNVNSNYVVSANADTLGLTRASCLYSILDSTWTGAFTVQAVSDSALDITAVGTGARSITLNYYSTAQSSSITTATIAMNGLTRTVLGNPNNFYRLESAFVSSTGVGNENAGNIYIFESTAAGATIPTNHIISVIPATWNRNNYGWFFFPWDPQYSFLHIDYANIAISSSSTANNDWIRLEQRRSSDITGSSNISIRNQEFWARQGNTDTGVSLHLNTNLITTLPSNAGVDLLITYNHSDASDAFFSVGIGSHYNANGN